MQRYYGDPSCIEDSLVHVMLEPGQRLDISDKIAGFLNRQHTSRNVALVAIDCADVLLHIIRNTDARPAATLGGPWMKSGMRPSVDGEHLIARVGDTMNAVVENRHPAKTVEAVISVRVEVGGR